MTHGLTIYPAIGGDSLLSLQVHQKRPVCPTCDNTFISLNLYTHPFIFTRPASSEPVSLFQIKDSNDNVIETLETNMISIINAGSVDYITCVFQSLGIDSVLSCGHYYYYIECGSEVYYSELFLVINSDLMLDENDIAVNGQFIGSLSGWTVTGSAGWISAGGGRAEMPVGSSIGQIAPGTGMTKITVTVLSTFTGGMSFEFGSFVFEIIPGDNIFYVPSGLAYKIVSNDTVDSNPLYVDSVVILQLESVECHNLIVARNSCNKNSIPYVNTGYADVFILDAELYEPEYLRDEAPEENGNKDKSLSFLRIDKRWSMESSQTLFEPFIDELAKLPANDIIYIFNDSWRKVFSVFIGTMDIETIVEWQFDNKCNAKAKINIVENLVLNNSCCEDIEGLECCDTFNFEWSGENTTPDCLEITITVLDGNCSGLVYSLLTYNDGVLESEVIFEDAIVYEECTEDLIEHKLKASKFGCPDIIYNDIYS